MSRVSPCMKCPLCNEGSIEDDPQYGNVCTSCGYIFHEEVFESGGSQFEGTSVVNQSRNHVNFNVKCLPRSLQSLNTISITKGKEFGLQLISSVSSYLRLPSVVKEEVEALFVKLVNDKTFKPEKLPQKAALVACCTYIVLRMKGFPIMISRICNFLQCSASNFNKSFYAVLKFTGITVTTPSIDELVPSILKNLNLGDEIEKIIPIVLDILHLARDCWITCGRIPQPFIIAAGFIAWKSLSFERRKCSFAAFCKKAGVKEHQKSSTKRLRELTLALMKLAEELPWNEKGKVNTKDIPYMLDNILRHSELLRVSAIQPEDSDHVKEFQTFRTKEQKRKREVVDETCNYSDSFDDDSVDIYIRTEREVQDLKKFMNEKEET